MDRISTKGSMIDQIDLSKVPHSGFDRSFHNYLSCKLGKIVPTRCEEVLPGDRIKGSTHIVANFEPLVAPILGNMVLKQETFYVPQSILWKSAHNFFTGKKGFNNPILSVTLKDMYLKIQSYTDGGNTKQICPIEDALAYVFSAADAVTDFDWNTAVGQDWSDFLTELLGANDFGSYVTDISNGIPFYLTTFGNKFYVLDLLQPLIKLFTDFKYDAEDNEWIGDSSYSVDQQKEYLINFFVDILNFWLGPSSLADYLGVGVYNFKDIVTYAFTENVYELNGYFSEIPLNWLPFRAAYSIWYWNYRDQLLEPDALDAEEFMENDQLLTAEIPLLLLLRVRCWFKDTFTTALTNTGNGNLSVPALTDLYSGIGSTIETGLVEQDLSQTKDANGAKSSGSDVQTLAIGGIEYTIPSNYLIHNTDLQSSDSQSADYYVSLDMIDRARRMSTWLSKRLILGVEYDDVVYSSFMVKLSHVRMRVPELLDASRATVAMNTVINNTTIPDAQVAGDKTAVAWCESKSDGVNYFAEEHGYLLSFFTILPIQSYAGGIQRMYLRQNRFDFAWPEFSQMGFDAIYNAELATPVGGSSTDASAIQVFGYQGRYYDYKSKLDEEHGRMRSDLNYMTFSRDFSLFSRLLNNNSDNLPKLNYMFVHCWPQLDMFVTDDPNVDIVRSVDIAHNFAWERVLPVPSETIR